MRHFGKSAVNKQSAVYLHSHIALRSLGTKNAITHFFPNIICCILEIQWTLSRDLGRNIASMRYVPQKFIFLFLCRSTIFHVIKNNIYHTFTCIPAPQIIYAKSEGIRDSNGTSISMGATWPLRIHCIVPGKRDLEMHLILGSWSARTVWRCYQPWIPNKWKAGIWVDTDAVISIHTFTRHSSSPHSGLLERDHHCES